MRLHRTALAGGILLLAAGCTAEAAPTPAAPPAAPVPAVPAPAEPDASEPAPAEPATPEPATSHPAAPAPAAGEVTLAFAGDVHFEDDLRNRLDDPETALDPVDDLLGAADVTVVNLETAITERGRPEPKKYHFRTSPAALDALDAAGVDVVSMANNHAVDYGADGLTDTLAAREKSPVPVIGIGRDAKQAFAPARIDVRGTKVAVLAATQVPDHTVAAWPAGRTSPGVASARDPDRLLRAVRRAAKVDDVVVVYLHYGTERVACPTGEQRDIAAALTDAGADVVVGAHAHVLLGAGWRGSSYVSYGLGNFVWYSPNSHAEASSGVLRVTVADGRATKVDLAPTLTGRDGLPRPLAGTDARKARRAWKALRDCTRLAARPS